MACFLFLSLWNVYFSSFINIKGKDIKKNLSIFLAISKLVQYLFKVRKPEISIINTLAQILSCLYLISVLYSKNTWLSFQKKKGPLI